MNYEITISIDQAFAFLAFYYLTLYLLWRRGTFKSEPKVNNITETLRHTNKKACEMVLAIARAAYPDVWGKLSKDVKVRLTYNPSDETLLLETGNFRDYLVVGVEVSDLLMTVEEAAEKMKR